MEAFLSGGIGDGDHDHGGIFALEFGRDFPAYLSGRRELRLRAGSSNYQFNPCGVEE